MAALPIVGRTEVLVALDRFDQQFRDTPAWTGWQMNSAQVFALVEAGKRYPPKKIISIATGVPVDSFSGGHQSNAYLTALGFEVVSLEDNGNLKFVPSFEVGRVYDRWSEINDPYGGSRQSGISASRVTQAIFLFSGESGEQYGYKDHFDEQGVFWYSDEGQIGDMRLDKGNYAISEHATQGRALHAFKTLRKAKGQRYVGEFTYASHEFDDELDKAGNRRRVIIFHLIPVGMLAEDSNGLVDTEDRKDPIDLTQARIRAIAALGPTEQEGSTQAIRTLYERSRTVRDYVLMRANGSCESCRNPHRFNDPTGLLTWKLTIRHAFQIAGSITLNMLAPSAPVAIARFTMAKMDFNAKTI